MPGARDIEPAGGRKVRVWLALTGWVYRDKHYLLDSEQSHDAWIERPPRGRLAAPDAGADVGGNAMHGEGAAGSAPRPVSMVRTRPGAGAAAGRAGGPVSP